MEDARKLLDSLMGQTRDATMAEAKKSKGNNFKKDDVCKFFLLGFCPYQELSESKMCVKRNIGTCKAVHSDAVKAEFEEHPEHKKHRVEYEKLLLESLERQVREADAWVQRETTNMNNEMGPPKEVKKDTMPPAEKEKYDNLKEDIRKMMATAEDDAENGNLDASKFKVMLAEEIKEKVQELEERYPVQTYTVTHRGEEVCKVCGVRFESLTANNQARYNAHFKGAVHRTYAKIREWIKDLKKNQGIAALDAPDGSRDRDRRRDEDQDRDKDRDRKRDGDRGREQDKKPDRERERNRSRSRRDTRGSNRDRDRDRERDRDRDRR